MVKETLIFDLVAMVFCSQDGQFYFKIHRQGDLDNDDLCLESRNSLALISYGGQQSSEELCPSLNWYCILYARLVLI